MINKYCKVVISRLSWLVAHPRIFRLLMNRKFDAYVLWPLTKRFQNWIIDRSTARDFMVSCLLLRAVNSNFLLGRDLALFVDNGTKVKIPSEIKLPLRDSIPPNWLEFHVNRLSVHDNRSHTCVSRTLWEN